MRGEDLEETDKPFFKEKTIKAKGQSVFAV